MIILHTFENAFDDGDQYHQFIQRGPELLDSEALGSEMSLREFLERNIIEDSLISEEHPRFRELLERCLAAKAIDKLLDFAERIYVRDVVGEVDMKSTRFGEWTFDSKVIVPPSLRETVSDVWGEADAPYTKAWWNFEIANDRTTLGYWEWVEHMRETTKPLQLIASHGSLEVAFEDIHHLEHREHFDGDDALLILRYPAGDCDTVRWPNPNIQLLRGALYDARETGLIADVKSVLLPDGSEFFIDEPYWKVGDHVTWNDPDDGVCSRTGVLTKVTHLNDSDIRIVMEDGWEAEVCESELRRVEE